MNLTFQQAGDSGLLTILGEMGIESAPELKSALEEALAAVTSIEADLAGITSASLCCLQLLCSAHRTAAAAGKTFTLKKTGIAFAGSVADAGFLRHVGCRAGNGSDCLWLDKSGV